LAHEQAHFDISEIFARRLHQEMKKYRPNYSTLKKDVSAIYDKIIKEEKVFQEMYDDETSHSRKKGRQQEWLEKIEQLLEETDAYADYP
jgi:predicted secreted Zn-dependent protease